ncbi:TMEM175 family protein [Herbiconiux sp. UC225_62]|uniref:TMEM175 family protein n=1 Tax=Herbiconiux sp. UC225_62 TaxID=3350168 RepID=UPI0036D308A2
MSPDESSDADTDRDDVSTRRLEAFTDGVFAIAATLLVLDLSVNTLGPAITDDAGLWTALLHQSHSFVSFVISFLLLGLLWSIHVWEFEHIVRVTRPLVLLNNLRLLGIVLIPFTTSLSSDYPELLAGRILLPINFLLVTALGLIEWSYATRPSRRLTAGLSEAGIRSARNGAIVAVVSSVITVALAPFFGPWAFLAFALNPLADRIPGLNRPRRGRA